MHNFSGAKIDDMLEGTRTWSLFAYMTILRKEAGELFCSINLPRVEHTKKTREKIPIL